MLRSREKRDRVPTPRQSIQTRSKPAAHGFVTRSRIEGKQIGPSPVTFIPRGLAEPNNMVKPLTKLAPWRAASRVTRKANGNPSAAGDRIPPAARSIYPITSPPQATVPKVAVELTPAITPAVILGLAAAGSDGSPPQADTSRPTRARRRDPR